MSQKPTINFPGEFHYEGVDYGPGEVEFDLSKPADANAYDVLSRTVATESHGGRTIAKDSDLEAAAPTRRKRRSPAAKQKDENDGS